MRKTWIAACMALTFGAWGAVVANGQIINQPTPGQQPAGTPVYQTPSAYQGQPPIIQSSSASASAYRGVVANSGCDSCDSPGCSGGCDSAIGSCNNACGRGFYWGTEVTVLRPFHSEGQTTGYDYRAAPRLWLGFQKADGNGFRARWWEMETNGPATARYDDLHFMLFDLEATHDFQLGCKWNGIVSTGFRYAEYREEEASGNYLEQDGAVGVVAGIEARRNMFRNINMYVGARTSMLFANSITENGAVSSREDTTFTVSELQMGTEFVRPARNGATFFARVGTEAQYWSGVSDFDTEDTSLIGTSFAIGIRR